MQVKAIRAAARFSYLLFLLACAARIFFCANSFSGVPKVAFSNCDRFLPCRMSTDEPFGLRGFVIDAPELGALRSHPDGALIVERGRIAAVGDYANLRRSELGRRVPWKDFGAVVIFPGLIDCHTHLPQYPAVAHGQSGLLPWLRESIFPIEREFTDLLGQGPS